MSGEFHPIVNSVIDGFDKKPWSRKPNLIIVHHTGTNGKILKTMDKLKRMAMNTNIARYLGMADKTYVSAHFQIGYEGEIIQIVDPTKYVAYHAGHSQWYDPLAGRVMSGCNAFSVGIELFGDGNQEPYSDAQIDSLTRLIIALSATIPSLKLDRIAGHSDVAPMRKVDPGKYFPWAQLEAKLGVKINRLNWGLPSLKVNK